MADNAPRADFVPPLAQDDATAESFRLPVSRRQGEYDLNRRHDFAFLVSMIAAFSESELFAYEIFCAHSARVPFRTMDWWT
jgi:hypothetical protein